MISNSPLILLPFLMIFSSSCISSQSRESMENEQTTTMEDTTINAATTKAEAPTLSDFLTKIPEDLLVDYNHKSIKDNWLNQAESTALLNGQEQVDRESNKIRLLTNEPENNNLLVDYGNDEESVGFTLQFWEDGNTTFLGITQTFIDHCCAFSNFFFYEIKGDLLVDVTDEKVPSIEFSDFVAAAFIPKNEEEYELHFAKDLRTDGFFPNIEIVLGWNALELSYTESEYQQIEEHLIREKAYLVWEDGRFVKRWEE